jgi:hypothetical protein
VRGWRDPYQGSLLHCCQLRMLREGSCREGMKNKMIAAAASQVQTEQNRTLRRISYACCSTTYTTHARSCLCRGAEDGEEPEPMDTVPSEM